MMVPKFIRPLWSSLLFMCVVATPLLSASSGEKVIWRLGKTDSSSHEFAALPAPRAEAAVVVRPEEGNAESKWPRFQPGSGNGRTGAKPYPYTLVFPLKAAPKGVFYLDLHLLYREPRVPALQVEVNGKRGMYFFEPKLGSELGGENDQFNPVHSVASRKLELPASLFRLGENRLTLTAIDEPALVSQSLSVGAEGDSGIHYDSLSLSNDPAAAPATATEFAFEPTIFYTGEESRPQEECLLTVRSPAGSKGGTVRLKIGGFTTSLSVAPQGEFGEARYTVTIPDEPRAREAEIRFQGSGAVQKELETSIRFTPARKWTIYYAPHEHLDIGYTDYRPKVAEVFAENMDRLMDMFRSNPSYRFNIDGSWIVDEWLSTRTARQAQRFAENARAGRIGLNAFYADFVTGYPSFETLTRALYGSKKLQQKYGLPFDFAQVTDIPSNSWSIPSVLASAGVRYFADGGNQDRGPLLIQGHWNAKSPFWWEGPDGQRVLSFYSRHYHQLKAVFGLPPNVEAGRQGLPRFLQTYSRPDYKPDMVLLYGTEVENLPMEYRDASFAKEWNSRFLYPRITICRFADYFHRIEERYGTGLPVVRGGGGDYWADNEAAFAEGTARDRSNQSRVLSAEKLSALNATINHNLLFPLAEVHRIWRDILLFAEHTYGSFRTGGQPEHDEVLGQLREKNNQTIRAESGIDKLMRRSLSQLANEIPTPESCLLVYNPLSWTRSGLVRFQVGEKAVLTDLATRQRVNYEVVEKESGYQTIRFWANDIPPLGYKVYGLSTERAATPGQGTVQGNVLENRYYKITLDPVHGAIRSIFDKQMARELVDSASPYAFNEYLFVTGGVIGEGSGGKPQMTRLSQPWNYLPPANLTVHHAGQGRLVSLEKTPWGIVARLEANALHTPKIQMEIRLLDDARRIEIRNRIQVDLLYTKEAAYFAFPWKVSQPVFRFDIANGWIDPAKDLLEGAGSEWSNVQHWVSVEDKTGAMGLAVGSTPLVTLGDINRGRWPGRFSPSSPAVFSYALTNYWSSKWAGKKVGEFDYSYAVTSAPAFDPLALTRFGYEQRNPLEVSEIKSKDKLPEQQGVLPAGTGSLAEVSPDNLIVTAIKGAEDGNGLVVRIMEIAGRETEGRLSLPWMTVGAANDASSVETPGRVLGHDAHNVSFHVEPHGVQTMRIAAR